MEDEGNGFMYYFLAKSGNRNFAAKRAGTSASQ
jgi:hypothetical protein